EIIDAGLAHPLARDAQDLAALVVVLREVMVGDHYDLRWIPHLGAKALEHRLQSPRAARVVHHGEIDLARHDFARRDALAPGRARNELLRERLAHPCSRNSRKAFSGGFT